MHCIMKYGRVSEFISLSVWDFNFLRWLAYHCSDCLWLVLMRSHSWEATSCCTDHSQLSPALTALLLYNMRLDNINVHALYALVSYWYFICCNCAGILHWTCITIFVIPIINGHWLRSTVCTDDRRLQLYFPANLVICCMLCDEGGTGVG